MDKKKEAKKRPNFTQNHANTQVKTYLGFSNFVGKKIK